MNFADKTILVFGATGQQGGAVASALRAQGWQVSALVRDPDSAKSKVLAESGIQLVRGDLADTASIEAAMVGVYGVFSVQPSSGQGAVYNLSDEDEVRYGRSVADIALQSGVRHLVYSSTVAAGQPSTGMGHFDSKTEIEEYVRGLGITSTIVRPATFMEILALPGMGLDQGSLSFFMRPDQSAQFIAVEDIGRIVAGVFAELEEYSGQTFDIAGDEVTGAEVGDKFSRAAGQTIAYHRFPDSLLQENEFLGKLAGLFNNRRLAGHADLEALRVAFPGLLSMDDWLAGSGKAALEAAIESKGEGVALR